MAKLLLSIFAATVLFGTLAALYLAGDDKFLELSSPDGTYSVILRGDPERPMLLTNTVSFDVLKNRSSYLQNEYLHSGDFMDASFAAGYPESEWVNGSTLRLFKDQDQDPSTKIQVRISNNSGRLIRFAKLFTSDKFIMLDLAEGATVDLHASAPRGDFMGFYLEGEFGDERRFDKGTSFEFNRMDSSCDLYTVTISDNEIDFNCS